MEAGSTFEDAMPAGKFFNFEDGPQSSKLEEATI
jgi:hypothetical protein